MRFLTRVPACVSTCVLTRPQICAAHYSAAFVETGQKEYRHARRHAVGDAGTHTHGITWPISLTAETSGIGGQAARVRVETRRQLAAAGAHLGVARVRERCTTPARPPHDRRAPATVWLPTHVGYIWGVQSLQMGHVGCVRVACWLCVGCT